MSQTLLIFFSFCSCGLLTQSERFFLNIYSCRVGHVQQPTGYVQVKKKCAFEKIWCLECMDHF